MQQQDWTNDSIDDYENEILKKVEDVTNEVNWTDEQLPEDDDPPISETKEKVTEKDKFHLAKYILAITFLVFVCLAALMVFIGPSNEGLKTIWDFYSVGFNSIASLIIGFYFRDKLKS